MTPRQHFKLAYQYARLHVQQRTLRTERLALHDSLHETFKGPAGNPRAMRHAAFCSRASLDRARRDAVMGSRVKRHLMLKVFKRMGSR